jgi:vacuolar-type H+-ATPase subunit I/STV1
MDESRQQRWRRTVILLGVVYLVVGLTFGALAGVSSNRMRVTWRFVAWLISAAAFAAHIGHEHLRLRNSPVTIAVHASLAVGLGAFGLAVAANIHAQGSGSSHQRALALALVAWPVLTAVPAFVVALGAAALLTLRRRGV